MINFSEVTEERLHEVYSRMYHEYTEIIAEELCGKHVSHHKTPSVNTAMLTTPENANGIIDAIEEFTVQSSEVKYLRVGIQALDGSWYESGVILLEN